MTRLTLPRAAAATLDAATQNEGEIFYDTTNDELRIGDGVTAGGKRIPTTASSAVAISAAMEPVLEASTLALARAAFSVAYKTAIYPEDFEAAGDGVRGVSGVATATDATFTDANASWTSADVGKAIVIQGAGTAGAAHATTIASINSATSIELTAVAVTTVASDAEYVYGTDDTAEFTAALATIGIGDALELTSGKIYCVQNITLPVPTDPLLVWSNSHQPNAIFCSAGSAEISIIGGGDTTYGIAPTRWVNNSAFSQQSWEFAHIHFNGNKLVDALIVVKSFRTRFFECHFDGANVDEVRITRQNKDASDGCAASDFLSGCGFWRCHFEASGTNAGLHSQGTAADATQSATDGWIVDCEFAGTNSSTPYGILLGNAGGWAIHGNHTYSHNTYGINILSLSDIGSLSGNTCEDPGRVVHVGTTINPIRIGGHNSWWTGLTVEYDDDTDSQTVILQDDEFTEAAGGGADGQLTLTTTHDEKVLVVVDCVFKATTPIVVTTAGVVSVQGGRDGNGDMGYQYWADGATGGPDLNLFRVSTDTAAASDVLGRVLFQGLNASGTKIDYFRIDTVIANAGAGTEAAFGRIARMTGGTLTNLFEIRSSLNYVGGGDVGAGNFNASSQYAVAGTKVIGTRKTGWTAATGTADRTTFATYTAPDITNPPTEAEVQAIADHVQILSRHLKALIDDLHSTAGHGAIGA